MSIDAPGRRPVAFDLGTGLRFWGDHLAPVEPLQASVLLTHLHWDHVQGLPFFEPIHVAGAELVVYGPRVEGKSLEAAFNEFMCPPYFPVGPSQLLGQIDFREFEDDTIDIDGMSVTAAPVPHVGATNGYRLTVDGVSIVYISDHQEPLDGSMTIDERVLELCDGADLLIHDAQYTRSEWVERAHWGHCTDEFAMRVAAESGAKCLALYHHDPSHDDQRIAAILSRCIDRADELGVPRVEAASEGMQLAFEGSAPVRSSEPAEAAPAGSTARSGGTTAVSA